MQLTCNEWLELAGLTQHEIPDLLILEGTWWHKKAVEQRLAYLTNVRETKLPDMYTGTYQNRRIMFCCAYGAPRAIEPVHICGIMGTPIVVQIGSCGALQKHIKTGDIVIPDLAHIGEGASEYYGQHRQSIPDLALTGKARTEIMNKGITTHTGSHLTTSALFQQDLETIKRWNKEGYLAVDMETSAVFSVAQYFKMRAASMLFVWDELLRGRTWLDTFNEEETALQATANQATFEAALKLN
ncbi:MAG: hypothetical protein CL398_03030 [Acidiferrobacteraceae bacterium]|nr:hypothetical protein [Acidiferrobacteraceae bacterium]